MDCDSAANERCGCCRVLLFHGARVVDVVVVVVCSLLLFDCVFLDAEVTERDRVCLPCPLGMGVA